jgi:hypothetical protein
MVDKLDCYDERKICRELCVKESLETPMTLTCLSVDFLELKTDRMQNHTLHTESASRYKHHIQVMMGYYQTGNGS